MQNNKPRLLTVNSLLSILNVELKISKNWKSKSIRCWKNKNK